MEPSVELCRELNPYEQGPVPAEARANHYFYDGILNVGDLEKEQGNGKQKRWPINVSHSEQESSTGFRWQSAITGS